VPLQNPQKPTVLTLSAQLEQKLLKLDKRLAELDKLRKKRRLFAQALKQIRGEAPTTTTPPLATGQAGKKSAADTQGVMEAK